MFLVGELEQISIVVGLEHPARGSIEVLSAAGWCQVRIVARYLGYLERSIKLGSSSRQVGAFGSIGLWHGRDTWGLRLADCILVLEEPRPSPVYRGEVAYCKTNARLNQYLLRYHIL